MYELMIICVEFAEDEGSAEISTHLWLLKVLLYMSRYSRYNYNFLSAGRPVSCRSSRCN